MQQPGNPQKIPSSQVALFSQISSGPADARLEAPLGEQSSPVICPPETSTRQLPPMLLDYLQYKQRYPDYVIFYQVGDFYEVFFEDALLASSILQITLTSRDKSDPNPVPMCGVPVAAVDSYLERIVQAGYAAALVSQFAISGQQDKRQAIERRLTRIITPGVRISSSLDAEDQERFIASLSVLEDDQYCLAVTSIIGGRVRVWENLTSDELVEQIRRENIAELVLPAMLDGQRLDRRYAWVRGLERAIPSKSLRFRHFTGTLSSRRETELNKLPEFAALGAAGRSAVKLLLHYLDEVTIGAGLELKGLQTAGQDDVLAVDASTRDNLEIFKNLQDGSLRNSLLSVVDRSVSTAGSRLIRRWLQQPLKEKTSIVARHEAVGFLAASSIFRANLRSLLKLCCDLERLAVRLELKIISPREAGSLRDTLGLARQITAAASDCDSSQRLGMLQDTFKALQFPDELFSMLEESLLDALPGSLGEGDIFKAGYSDALDALRKLRGDATGWISEFERSERARTGIASLKVKHNGVLGYFIELTRANASKAPADYLRRQSTAQTERFTTTELIREAAAAIGADEKAKALERDLFEQLRERLSGYSKQIACLGRTLAALDALSGFAELAAGENWERPEMFEDRRLILQEARHPVVSVMQAGTFIPNNLILVPDAIDDGAGGSAEDISGGKSPSVCALITGPNMGGKSTYLRQAGLLVLLAQAGSFVPARRAQIGIVDKLFARIGASDNISEGESTFMVEMKESAFILKNMSARSLVLIDEVGRGTATEDGLAIAQAILESLVQGAGVRALFATHFNQLTKLEADFPLLVNLSVGAIEHDGGVVFTHEIQRGPADKSYGLEVAKLAGIPAPVMLRAKELFSSISANIRGSQLSEPLAAEPAGVEPPATCNSRPCGANDRLVKSEIAAFDISRSTPLEALNLVARLKSLCEEYNG